MKISIERAALLKAVSQAQSVVERRNTIPILSNVLIRADGAALQLKATDLDIEVVETSAGATTVPGPAGSIPAQTPEMSSRPIEVVSASSSAVST